MKRQLFKLTVFITILFLASCNNKKETTFVETSISENYKIRLPANFEEIEEGTWEMPNKSFNLLNIQVYSGKVKNLEEEVEIEAKTRDFQEDYKGKVFIKKEKFKKNGFEGVILYYEKENKGKRLGLVTLKSYMVIAVVQDDESKIYINSISLNNNINEDISKSIKSIIKNSSLVEKKRNLFDEEKAKKDGDQIFKEDNFIIKCNGKILLDRLRIEQYKQSGQLDNTKPYHVFVKGVDYNINVGDYAYILKGQSNEEKNKYINESLEYFQTKLDEMEVKNQRKKFKNFDAVYYQNTSDGKLTKAVYFHHKMKSYTLQVSSNKNTDKLFDEFVNSFEIINK